MTKVDKSASIKDNAWKTMQKAIFKDKSQISCIRVYYCKLILIVVLYRIKTKTTRQITIFEFSLLL